MTRLLIAKNALFQFVGRFLITAAGFVVTILLARTFGVSGLGVFVAVTTYVSFGYLLSDFGLNAIYLKLDPKTKRFSDFFLTRLFLAGGLLMLLVLPVVLLSKAGINVFGITPLLLPGLLLFSLTILTQAVVTTCSAMFQLHSRYDKLLYSLLPGAIVLILLVALIILFRLPLVTVFAAYVVSGIVSATAAYSLSGKRVSFALPDKTFTRTLLLRGIPLGSLLIFNLLYFRIDILLLSMLKGEQAVGVYGYAYKFFDFALAIPLFLSNSLYPFLLGNQKNVRKGKVNEREYFFLFFLSGTLIGAVGVLLSPIIILAGEEFAASVAVLRVLFLFLPVFFLTSYTQWRLIARDKEKSLVPVYLGAAVLNIGLNLLFIPRYSFYAAAVTTGICEAVILLLLLFKLHYTKNLRKASTKRPLL